MSVYREVYEVTGAELKKRCREFVASRDAALKEQWSAVTELGAAGLRHTHNGSIGSLFYSPKAKVPAGLRKVGTDAGNVEYQPARNTKAGIEIAKRLAVLPSIGSWRYFSDKLGKFNRSPMSVKNGRSLIHFTVGVHVCWPKERFFMTYPRELKDRWKPPVGLKLVRESDMMRAMEDHNAIVRKRKQQRGKT